MGGTSRSAEAPGNSRRPEEPKEEPAERSSRIPESRCKILLTGVNDQDYVCMTDQQSRV
uniref:Uncharacterized protein n=1 Tax=Chlorobium phaeovibrioides (strain DSM 265 / 1930) TaxID=290318 RepID=A4SF90_CHLPM